jgi:uracil DNA glycosylase
MAKHNWWEVISKPTQELFATTLDNIREHYKLHDCSMPSPKIVDVLDCLRWTNPENLKVVILADPAETSTGKAIVGNSVQSEAEFILGRLFYQAFGTDQVDYARLASAGVLWLPTAFTTHHIPPTNHKVMWEPFVQAFIKELNQFNPIWIIIGQKNTHYQENMSTGSVDIWLPDLTHKNLDHLKTRDLFNEIDNLLDFIQKDKIPWIL